MMPSLIGILVIIAGLMCIWLGVHGNDQLLGLVPLGGPTEQPKGVN